MDAVPRTLQWLTKFREAKLVATELAGVLVNRAFFQNTGIDGKLKIAETEQLSILSTC